MPETVRCALRLGKLDKIHYRIRPDGEVVLTRVDKSDEADPALSAFLSFLENDLPKEPIRLNLGLMKRFAALVEHVDIYLDAPLAPEDE